MFQGPGGGHGFHDNDVVDPAGFPPTFDAFTHRQDFSANGFDLSTGEVVVASFADFASFDDEFHSPNSAEAFPPAAHFDDFANFSAFDSSTTGPADNSEVVGEFKDEIDFAPSEF